MFLPIKTERNWEGRVVPAANKGDIVTAWEVEPHVQSDEFDILVVRDWQDMLSTVKGGLEVWLETFTEEELREGVTLKFRLRDVRAEDLSRDEE